MTNEEFHAQLDVLATETFVEIGRHPQRAEQIIHDAFEEAISLDRELQYQRKFNRSVLTETKGVQANSPSNAQ